MVARFSLLLFLTFCPVPSNIRDWFWSQTEEMANSAYSHIASRAYNQQLKNFRHLFVKNFPSTPQEANIPSFTSTVGPITPLHNLTFTSGADNKSAKIFHRSNTWLFILLSSLLAVLHTTGVALGLRNLFLTTAIHTDSIES